MSGSERTSLAPIDSSHESFTPLPVTPEEGLDQLHDLPRRIQEHTSGAVSVAAVVKHHRRRIAYREVHDDRRRVVAPDAASLEYGARFEGDIRGVEQEADAGTAYVHDLRVEGGKSLGIGDAPQGRYRRHGGARFMALLEAY